MDEIIMIFAIVLLLVVAVAYGVVRLALKHDHNNRNATSPAPFTELSAQKSKAEPDSTVEELEIDMPKLPETQELPEKQKLSEKLRNLAPSETSGMKLLIIGFICLVSLIPLALVTSVIEERSRYANYAIDDVSESWGGEQMLSGPIIHVPYLQKRVVTETVEDKNAQGDTIEKTVTKVYWDQKSRVFLPDELNFNIEQDIQVRKRGIFEVPLYEAQFNITGKLPKLDFSDKYSEVINIQWHQAEAVFVVGDSIGIKQVNELVINEQNKLPLSGLGLLRSPHRSMYGGFHFKQLDKQCQNQQCSFAIIGQLNGVTELSFMPIARNNNINVTSQWPHPKFTGHGLPESHNITSEGFSAEWKVGNLVRSYPQVNNDITELGFIDEYIVGFDTINTVDHYSMSIRASKYGILIVGLTLFALFIFEYGLHVRIHTVQYLVTSGALFLFYLTLLSLSEHMPLLNSWIIAAGIITTMISVYIGVIIRSLKYGVVLFSYLVGVYTVMYALLKLEDYALLIGTVILLLVMTVIMFVTRKIHKGQ